MKLFAIKIGGALIGVIQSGDNTGPRTLEHAAQLEPLDSAAAEQAIGALLQALHSERNREYAAQRR